MTQTLDSALKQETANLLRNVTFMMLTRCCTQIHLGNRNMANRLGVTVERLTELQASLEATARLQCVQNSTGTRCKYLLRTGSLGTLYTGINL
jgi:hypothetical protein